jgi:hypothetical protein
MGVIDYLEKSSCQIISYTDDPTAFPQISFLKDDKPCYVNVYSHPSGIDQPEPLDASQINVLNPTRLAGILCGCKCYILIREQWKLQ